MTRGSGFKILLTASEVVGFSKTGGLADVAGSLPRALEERGHSCVVVAPLYRCTRVGKLPLTRTDHEFTIFVGNVPVTARLWRATLPKSEVPVYLVEQTDYFERDDPQFGRGLYQFISSHGSKRDYPDNCARFSFFCRAVLEAIPRIDFWPDVVHANDWQTGLLPVYLIEQYVRHAPPELREKYARIRTLFTIHNIAYQGMFWKGYYPQTNLEWRLFNYLQLEFYDHLNFLKSGIVFSGVINTVSPTYAREIQTRAYGCGMESLLAERRERLFGIVNGVDYGDWNPATDPHLPAHYGPDTVQEGKAACKAALQRHFGLERRPDVPVLGMIARLVDQKGVGLLGPIGDAVLGMDTQLVVLGDGDPHYHRMLEHLRDRHPGRVGLHLGFSEKLAHQIEAGSDMFLMPSLYEPSGLNQLYSLKYGTPPVVRATGGLVDTVTDTNPETLASGMATGFSFVSYTPDDLLYAIRRAVEVYRHRPDEWLRVVRTAMGQDWSWARSAAGYEDLYRRLCV